MFDPQAAEARLNELRGEVLAGGVEAAQEHNPERKRIEAEAQEHGYRVKLTPLGFTVRKEPT